MPESAEEAIAKTAVESGLITSSQLVEAMAERSQNPTRLLSDIIVDRGYATEDQVSRILEQHQKTRKSSPLPASISAKYEVGRELGRGGMGIVYEAVDRRLDRRVALKVIRSLEGTPGGGEEEIERFLRECRLSANLSKHPHIVSVYEADLADGRPYLAMEFVDGVAMSEWQTRKDVAIREKIALLRDVALAVDHAHAEGIIHRDLKPANVLVDVKGRPRVTDFGLAKRSRSEGAASLTGSGVIVGTPAYMSPEQAQGLKDIDRRTDVFSLGVMLYELLTGAIPFKGESAMQIIVKVIHDEVKPPSKVQGAVQDPHLEKVCLTALAKAPDQRYPTAAALARDLSFWLGEAEARPPARRRHRRVWVAVALTLVAAAVLVTILISRSHPAPPREVAALGLAGQLNGVVARLRELNPGFDGKVTPTIDGGELAGLEFPATFVKDLSPLRTLPALRQLRAYGVPTQRGMLEDLSPLRGMKLTRLSVDHTKVRDLSPLRGLPLEELAIGGTEVRDLSPLRGMPLKGLFASYAPVTDLGPLAGLPLETLHLDHTKVSDLSPLRGARLSEILITGSAVRDPAVLRSIGGLLRINEVPAAEFWKRDNTAFAASVAGLAPEEQIARVMKRLQDLNPGFDGKVLRQEIKDGKVYRLEFKTHVVTDISPVRALPALAALGIGGSGERRGTLADLSQLTGLALRTLDVHNTSVRDLSPIRDLPLEELSIGGTSVTDITPIRGMKLKAFYASYVAHVDVGVLSGMPLRAAHFDHTDVSDLSPLKGAPLRSLSITSSRVADLGPLKYMPLEELDCDAPELHVAVLKEIPTLKTINQRPAAEVLK